MPPPQRLLLVLSLASTLAGPTPTLRNLQGAPASCPRATPGGVGGVQRLQGGFGGGVVEPQRPKVWRTVMGAELEDDPQVLCDTARGILEMIDTSSEHIRGRIAQAADEEERARLAAEMASHVRNAINASIEVLNRTLELDPYHAEGLVLLAEIEESVDNRPRARSLFARAYAAEPGAGDSIARLGELAADDGDYAEADAFFEAAQKHRPDDVDIFVNRGRLLRLLDRLSEAEELLTKALALEPYNADVLVNFGAVRESGGDPDLVRAEELYRLALFYDPDNAAASANLARLTRNKDEEGAIAAAERLHEQAQRVYPNSAAMLTSAGVTQLHKGDTLQAESLFHRALNFDPGFLPALHNFGCIPDGEIQDLEAARRRFGKALSLSPYSSAVLTCHARLEEAHGSIERAEGAFKAALEDKPEDGEMWREYALCLMRTRNDEGRAAERMLNIALSFNPEDAKTYCNLATLCQTARNDLIQAEELFKRALSLDPNDAVALWNYSALLFVAGRSDESEEMRAKARRIMPDIDSSDVVNPRRRGGGEGGESWSDEVEEER